MLPFVGIFLTMGRAVLACLSQGLAAPLIMLAAMLFYKEFESRVLVPLVYGRTLRLQSSLVLFALMAGGTLACVLDALLALPVAATIPAMRQNPPPSASLMAARLVPGDHHGTEATPLSADQPTRMGDTTVSDTARMTPSMASCERPGLMPNFLYSHIVTMPVRADRYSGRCLQPALRVEAGERLLRG